MRFWDYSQYSQHALEPRGYIRDERGERRGGGVLRGGGEGAGGGKSWGAGCVWTGTGGWLHHAPLPGLAYPPAPFHAFPATSHFPVSSILCYPSLWPFISPSISLSTYPSALTFPSSLLFIHHLTCIYLMWSSVQRVIYQSNESVNVQYSFIPMIKRNSDDSVY